MSQLFARKGIGDVQPPEGAQSLKRVLGAGDLVMLTIGAVIGAGIFGAIGTAAAGQIGPDGDVIRYGAGPALVAACVFVMVGLPGQAWMRFGWWLALGLLIYFIYGVRHSRLCTRA